jgi:hypothetical protein
MLAGVVVVDLAIVIDRHQTKNRKEKARIRRESSGLKKLLSSKRNYAKTLSSGPHVCQSGFFLDSLRLCLRQPEQAGAMEEKGPAQQGGEGISCRALSSCSLAFAQ